MRKEVDLREVDIKDDEQVDDLQYRGYSIIQKKTGFRFGLDAVLLADFADVKKGSQVIDLGTGTGIVSILIAAKRDIKRIVGLEIQTEIADMAKRSAIMNSFMDKLEIVCGDIKYSSDLFGNSSFDEVVTNPPYFSAGKGLICENESITCSRHEILCDLEDVIRESSKLLRPGGSISMVHRPFRLPDIISLMRKWRIEPKLMRMVQPKANKPANLVLIKGYKDGKPELKMLPTLLVFNEDGTYTKEIDEIYNRDTIWYEFSSEISEILRF